MTTNEQYAFDRLKAEKAELLEACKEALKRGSFMFNGSEDKHRVEDLLSQAISKAEGR